MDPENGYVHNDAGKETTLHSFHKKCESIRKAYRLDVEDCDTVGGIMDELRQAKNKLASFVKEVVTSERFKEIRKELFEIIVKVIRESWNRSWILST